MKINNIQVIKAVGLFLFLSAIYTTIMQVWGFYLFWNVLHLNDSTKINFGFSTWSLIISVLLTISFLIGSILFFKLKMAGLYLLNIVVSLGVVLISMELIFPSLLKDNVIEGGGYFVFRSHSVSWQSFLFPILYIFILGLINTKYIKQKLIS